MASPLPQDLTSLLWLKRKPEKDGEVLMYSYETQLPSRLRKYFDYANFVIFVNGVTTGPERHKRCAEELSKYSNCRVIGVYNATDGLAADLFQCIGDKFTSDPVGLLHERVVQLSENPSRRHQQEFDRRVPDVPKRTILTEDDIVQFLSGNPATVSLFHVLRHPQMRRAKLVAHSQGNFIAINALKGVSALDGSGSIQGREVWSYGSPAVSWPPGINHRDFRNSFDPVSWLGGLFGRTTEFKLSGDPLSHDFPEYIQCEALRIDQFSVRFGMVFKRDAHGLACELEQMGTNFRLVKKVFDRLQRSDRFDAAQVACNYVEYLTDPMLGNMRRDWSDLIELLIKILEQEKCRMDMMNPAWQDRGRNSSSGMKNVPPTIRERECARRLRAL